MRTRRGPDDASAMGPLVHQAKRGVTEPRRPKCPRAARRTDSSLFLSSQERRCQMQGEFAHQIVVLIRD